MIWAIISVILGVLSLITTIPIVVPVIGLALGANALIRKKEDKKQAVIGIAIAGLVFNGIVTFIFVINSLTM